MFEALRPPSGGWSRCARTRQGAIVSTRKLCGCELNGSNAAAAHYRLDEILTCAGTRKGRQRSGAKGLLGLSGSRAATRRRTRPSGILPGKRGGMSAGASGKQGGDSVAASSDDAHADLAHPAQARVCVVSQDAWSGKMGAYDSSDDERTAASPHSH